MKRSPLKRKTPLRAKSFNLPSAWKSKPTNTLKTHKPMRRVSKTRQKENKLYAQVRKDYLTTHPRCQVCVTQPACDIHHRRGRWKSRLYDATYFLAVCRPCHDRIHHNPEWAYEKGLLLPR